MQVDIRVPVGDTVPRVADFIARCEDAGFDGVGVHDHPHAGRDVYVTLALAAQRTKRLNLYPATSSPSVRHPLLLASLAHSLEEIAPGRISLSVSPGFLSVRSLGRPQTTVAAMREAVVAVRRLLAGQSGLVGSVECRMRTTGRQPTPVYLLAAGPRMIELAGEVADGALMFVGLHPDAIACARQHLAVGARRANRSLSTFKTIFIVSIAMDDSVAAAQHWIQRCFEPGRPWLTYPSVANLYWLKQAGFDLPDPLLPGAIPADLAVRIADAFGLFGPAERCTERLLRAHEAGVEHVFLFPAHTLTGGYDLPVREVEAFGRVMRSHLTPG